MQTHSSELEFPLGSFVSFLVAFAATWLICVAVMIFGMGVHEPKWSPEANFMFEAAGLFVLLPVVALLFALGIYSIKRDADPWPRAMAGGVIAAVLVHGIGQVSTRMQSEALGLVMVWGTILLMPAAMGAMARAIGALHSE